MAETLRRLVHTETAKAFIYSLRLPALIRGGRELSREILVQNLPKRFNRKPIFCIKSLFFTPEVCGMYAGSHCEYRSNADQYYIMFLTRVLFQSGTRLPVQTMLWVLSRNRRWSWTFCSRWPRPFKWFLFSFYVSGKEKRKRKSGSNALITKAQLLRRERQKEQMHLMLQTHTEYSTK